MEWIKRMDTYGQYGHGWSISKNCTKIPAASHVFLEYCSHADESNISANELGYDVICGYHSLLSSSICCHELIKTFESNYGCSKNSFKITFSVPTNINRDLHTHPYFKISQWFSFLLPPRWKQLGGNQASTVLSTSENSIGSLYIGETITPPKRIGQATTNCSLNWFAFAIFMVLTFVSTLEIESAVDVDLKKYLTLQILYSTVLIGVHSTTSPFVYVAVRTVMSPIT